MRHVGEVHLDGVLVFVHALAHALEERAPQQLHAHRLVHLWPVRDTCWVEFIWPTPGGGVRVPSGSSSTDLQVAHGRLAHGRARDRTGPVVDVVASD